MNDTQRLQLVGAATRSGFAVLEKSASANSAQQEVLAAGWPSADEQISGSARLARVLGTGLMVEESEESLHQGE